MTDRSPEQQALDALYGELCIAHQITCRLRAIAPSVVEEAILESVSTSLEEAATPLRVLRGATAEDPMYTNAQIEIVGEFPTALESLTGELSIALNSCKTAQRIVDSEDALRAVLQSRLTLDAVSRTVASLGEDRPTKSQ